MKKYQREISDIVQFYITVKLKLVSVVAILWSLLNLQRREKFIK